MESDNLPSQGEASSGNHIQFTKWGKSKDKAYKWFYKKHPWNIKKGSDNIIFLKLEK